MDDFSPQKEQKLSPKAFVQGGGGYRDGDTHMVLVCLGLHGLHLCSIPVPTLAFVTSFIVCLMLGLC